MADLTVSPSGVTYGFNWVFLVELVICGILSLFFLFYFNRLFATVISYGIRAYTWHKYRAYIDITALQISLLGGRIFFKTIRYHAHNITVLVHDGHITWRYWLRNVQEAEIFADGESQRYKGRKRSPNEKKSESESGSNEKLDSSEDNLDQVEAGGKQRPELPCRISVKVSGVEAFLYNRSPSYDAIIEATLAKAQQTAREAGSEQSSAHHNSQQHEHEKLQQSHTNSTAPGPETVPQWLRILPIHIQCKRAAAALGNENTTSVLTAKVEQTSGRIDAAAAQALDLYKLLLNFEFKNITVAMKPNRDYKCPQANSAHAALKRNLGDDKPLQENLVSKFKNWLSNFIPKMHTKAKSGGSVRTASMHSNLDHPFQNSMGKVPGQAQWHGLTRYLDDEAAEERSEWQDVEYAKVSNLVDCPKVEMRFHFDIPGKVSSVNDDSTNLLKQDTTESQGSTSPPDYGLDLAVHGGFIVYGPWADRERVNLQQVFFPASCIDAVPKDLPRGGETRLATVFKLFLSIEEDVTLRIPTRENSKDGRWVGTASKGLYRQPTDPKQSKNAKKKKQTRSPNSDTATASADARPYGWLDVTVKPDSTVNYAMDMYARESGFRNLMDLDIKGTEITSSVNHALLMRSGALTLDGDLSNPLCWNSLRDWPFNIVCDDMELFILRDHLFLIIDLVDDWGSGAPPDFYTFIPFYYNMNIAFRNFIMYLNTNDANIINDPANLDVNDFLTFEGESLKGVLGIPLQNFRPKKNEITFDVDADNLSMRMLGSSKNTVNALLREKRVARLPRLTLIGSFEANQEQIRGLTDTLRMDIEGTGFTIQAYGFLLRHLINVKENYFGDFVHFKTLEEFQTAGETINDAHEQTASLPKPGTINELDVLLSIVVKNAAVMLPINLYSANEFVRIELPEALVDLRVTSYYLDMAINLSPVSIQMASTRVVLDSPAANSSNTQLYISHASVSGHRAFGLPPNEAPYVAIWEVDVGPITGQMKSQFLHDLIFAARALIFTFKDGENALPLDSPLVIFESTFVRVQTDILRVWLQAGDEAILFSADPVTVRSNDWANEMFSQGVTVSVPNLTVACVDATSAARHRDHRHVSQPVRTYAFLQTSIELDMVGRNPSFTKDAQRQQAFMRLNDSRTMRVPFLQRSGPFWQAASEDEEAESTHPPAMTYPPYPAPVHQHVRSGNPAISSRRISHKPSTSSLASSIRNGRPRTDGRQSRTASFTAQQSVKSHQSVRSKASDRDRKHQQADHRSSMMAFSSIYAAPYFPLDTITPDDSVAPAYIILDSSTTSDSASLSSTDNEDVDVEDDVAQITIMIRMKPGIRAYAEPHMGHVAAHLLHSIQAASTEEIMDAFQMDVLSNVTAEQERNALVAKVTQISLSLPSLAARVLNHADHEQESDVVDITLHSLRLLARLRTPSEQLLTGSQSFHILLSNVTAILRRGVALQEEDVALRVVLQDLLVWFALSKANTMRVTMADMGLEVTATAARYFVALVNRLMPLAAELQTAFSTSQTQIEQRLRLLLYKLTQLGEHVGDPPFLTKMTYILRAFPDHFRNQESWKILMRFRNILQSLPATMLDNLEQTFDNKSVACPDDAPQKILESWIQWRNWDVINIERTAAFKMILGEAAFGSAQDAQSKPVSLTWLQESMRLVIKDQHTESVLSVAELTFSISVEPPRAPTGLMLVEENKRTRTLAHLHSSSITISLQWNLIEVVDEILPQLLQNLPQQHDADTSRSTAQALEDEISRQEFHLVLSTDTASVSLHTVNVHHIVQAEGLRMSLIGTTQATEPFSGACVNVLLNADHAGTQLLTDTKMIWQSLLISPGIYIDHLQPLETANIPPTVYVSVTYKEVQLNVVELLPGILRTVDAVIAEEVARIMHLVETVQKHESEYSSEPQQKISTGPDRSAKIHVALLAGELTAELSLLKSLKYRLTGTAASVRVAPSLTESKMLAIDFETGTLHHSLVNVSHGEEHQQRIVDVPPINGHVVLHTAARHPKVSVMTTVGRLEIDAEALQAVATTLGRSEVQSVITAIKDGVEDIQERVQEVMPTDQAQAIASRERNDSSRMIYDVHLALAGIQVAATTPQGSTRATAAFELGIGACTAVASNQTTISTDDSPFFPEVRATLGDIGASLTIKGHKHAYPAGNVTLTLACQLSTNRDDEAQTSRELSIRSQKFEVNVYPETAAIIVDVINQLQDRLKHLDVSNEMEYIRSLRHRKRGATMDKAEAEQQAPTSPGLPVADLLAMKVKIDLTDVVMTWLVHDDTVSRSGGPVEDLVLTLAAIQLSAQGVREGRLTIKDLQLQLVPRGSSKQERSLNSALLPEIIFTLAHWSEGKDRNLALKASGKPLDLRLDSKFVIPFTTVKRSIDYSVDKFRAGTANWKTIQTASGTPQQNSLGGNHFASFTAEADFAGAQVYLQGASADDMDLARGTHHGRYGQFATNDGIVQTTLRSPGISLKFQYENKQISTVQAEMLVASSSNILLPNVVPLILDISKSVQEVMQSQDDDKSRQASVSSTKLAQSTVFDEAFATADPTAIFGKTKVNLGLRIARQEFGLTCQPIAKIDAKAELDDFYLTVSTIESAELGHFFAMSARLSSLSVKVKHVYSREPTFGFDMDSVVLSLMNSRHFSGVNGISAILKINPVKTTINGKQLQDLLLFREIWLPPEIRSATSASPDAPETADVLMQRYQTVARATAFPWNATIAVSELGVNLDLGQSLGKTSFKITNLWASSQKNSDAEQNLCVGLSEVAMNSTGRMSGYINMSELAVRTLIMWPEQTTQHKTPRIQASVGFGRMRAKAAFDYQAFAFGDIEGFDFMMYNVNEKHKRSDRLVAIVDCAKAYVFCTSTSPAQALSLYQAADRLIQEKQAAFTQSLKEIEKFRRRSSTTTVTKAGPEEALSQSHVLKSPQDLAPITLHTDVVLSLGNICVGAFPGTFFDSQLFKVEANNLQARFAVGLEQQKIRGGLGMTIGQLQVALAAVKKVSMPRSIVDLGVEEVVSCAMDSRGGVILKVPRVIASMETWQAPKSAQIEYIFKSLFEGKVDIGWNLSRINLIRGMWITHSRALAARMGKPLPESAVKITADMLSSSSDDHSSGSPSSTRQNKITAEVNLPQSKYEYIALEPPIIETPQLRDMGEATPPLEWIGLHRDRLPNVTHQIIIVPLLEVAKEVEDAYERILGAA